MKKRFNWIFSILLIFIISGCVSNRNQAFIWQRHGSLRVVTDAYNGWLKFAWASQGDDFFFKIYDWSSSISVLLHKKKHELWIWNQQKLVARGPINEIAKQQLGIEVPWFWLNEVFSGKKVKSEQTTFIQRVIYKDNELKRIILEDLNGKLIFYL